MKEQLVLGVDIGIQNTAGVILKSTPDGYSVISADHIETKPSILYGVRLETVQWRLKQCIESVPDIDAIAVEKVFFGRNVSSAMTTAGVLGVVHLLACSKLKPLFELTPQQIKNATGLGSKASKDDVVKMAGRIFENSELLSNHHLCDAAFAALTGQLKLRTDASIWTQEYYDYRDALPF